MRKDEIDKEISVRNKKMTEMKNMAEKFEVVVTFDARVHALNCAYVLKLARCFTVPRPLADFRDWAIVLADLRQARREVTDEMKDKVLTILEGWLVDL